MILIVRADSSIEIWDIRSNPYLEKVIPGTPTTSVETLAWCNGRLFSAGLYGYITEYDLESLVPKYQLSVTSSCPIWCMKFDYEGKCLAVGNEDGHVVLHQLSSEGLDFDKKCDKQEGCILCLDWHKEGQFIVTGSIDAIRVWNVNTGHVVNRIILARASKNVPTVVWCIAVTSDMTVISGDSCGKTSFWDGNTGTLLSASGAQKDDILTLVVNKDEDVIYTSGVDPTITMYMKSSNGMWLKSIQRVVHTHDVRSLQFVGGYLVSGGDDCSLIFTKYPPKTTIKFFPFCQKSYCKVASNPSCILLTYPNFVEVWSIGTFSGSTSKPTNLLRLKPKQNERIICSSISSNGKWLAYSSQLQIRLFCLKLESNSKDLPSFYKVSLPDNIPLSSIFLFTSEPTKLILYSKGKIYIVKCDSMQPTIENTIDTDTENQIQLMELSCDDEHLACSYHSGNVAIYNLSSLKIYTDGSKNEENQSGSGIYIKTPREVRKIKLRNPDNCSVFRSELLAIEAGLEAILNENNYGAVWILSDSRSSIQHLKDWNNVGDRTGISILKLLRHIGVDHEVHLQWIPSHVDIYGNEVADNLAKQGTAEPLCSTPSLTFDEIYSIRKNKDLKTWRVPPSHDWYKQNSPGGSIGLACDRADQTALSRFVSGHLRSCSFSHGNKVFLVCAKCGVASASPEHILSCLRLSRETFETDPLLALDFLRVQFELPVYKYQATALKFDPSSENLLVAYSDRRIVEYSLKKSAYSKWSKQQVLLEFQTATPHPVTSICFCSDKLFLHDENTLYVFDRKEEVQPGRKKIKQSQDSSISITESEYKTITKYEHISSIDSFMEDLVVVQISSSRILDSLPPPVWKKKYGT
ncbi:U3 small nucleolar RNA-associated protein 4 [Araneus ventricosus]|uniref:U3 small nucleolar RNA-associated protein 4 n=1 Tax=Araneus ventricosus TaxID=182803 RepID=A0A4Y2QYD9_ARAVE|nr:U3 small nucleolar RNA-associated protein 4 [Araneus ventricosus]